MGEITPINFIQKTLNREDIQCYYQDEMFKQAINSISDIEIDDKPSLRNRGIYLEFGLFVGTTAKKIIQYIPKDKYLYGFEGFCGLENDVTPEGLKGITALCGEMPEYPKQVKVIVGKLQDSLPQFLRWHGEDIAFINFDVSSVTVKDALFILADSKRLKKGTVITICHAIKLLNRISYDSIYKSFIESVEAFNIKYEYICFGDVHIAIKLIEDV